MAVEHSAFSIRSVAFISLLLFVCSLTEFTVNSKIIESLECDFQQTSYNNITAVIRGDIAGKFVEVELTYNENRCRSKGWINAFVNDVTRVLTIPDKEIAINNSEIATAWTVCCEVWSHTHPILETSNNIQECISSSMAIDRYHDVNRDPYTTKHRSLKSCEYYSKMQPIPGIGQQS